MITSRKLGITVSIGAVALAGLELGAQLGVHGVVPSADARVGRPLTPVSVAGVGRRCAAGVYNC